MHNYISTPCRHHPGLPTCCYANLLLSSIQLQCPSTPYAFSSPVTRRIGSEKCAVGCLEGKPSARSSVPYIFSRSTKPDFPAPGSCMQYAVACLYVEACTSPETVMAGTCEPQCSEEVFLPGIHCQKS